MVEGKIGSFWLTRIVFLRALAFIYCVAFAVSQFQNKALLGYNGILPIPSFMKRARKHFNLGEEEVSVKGFLALPTLYWWVPEEHTDLALSTISSAGIVLSLTVLLQGSANMFIMATLWALYHSIVNVGQQWYSFGWESQLLETGFLAIWLVPVFSTQLLPIDTPTSRVCRLGYRWLLFRIMLGAGLIKIRGDKCWRDLTCMNYHYETQPVPNPLSWSLHHLPGRWHAAETAGNHLVELVLPWLLLLPHRGAVAVGGAVQVIFQGAIIVSGNFSFLNWLTVLPAVFCFDDAHLTWLFSKATLHYSSIAEKLSLKQQHKPARYQRAVLNGSIGGILLLLSVPVVQNLLSPKQQMNTSFEAFRLVNTYGAFGSITKERTEVVLQGTHEDHINSLTKWKEYEFKCKPGDLTRRPCLITPYHYRLDWLMWFAAFQRYQDNPWFLSLVGKLLEGDEEVRGLIALDPFANSTTGPPKHIRAQHYRYTYTDVGAVLGPMGIPAYWNRQFLRPYMPAVSLEMLKDFRESNGLMTRPLPSREPSEKGGSKKKNRHRLKVWNMEVENLGPPIAGLFVVACMFLMRLFRRDLDTYYQSTQEELQARTKGQTKPTPDCVGACCSHEKTE